jgi:hypothetical protein
MQVVLDEDPPRLAALQIEGELSFASDQQRELRAGVITVEATGTLRAGTAAAPMSGRATITLDATDTNQSVGGMGTRGVLVRGGRLELHGGAPAVTWTKLDAHAAAGATQLTLAAQTGWRAGDRVVVTPTDWYPDVWAPQAQHDALQRSEQRVLAADASGLTLTLAQGLGAPRWGRMQYMTDAGLSLSPGTFTKPHPDAVDRIDERAEVANLSRRIVIQGADDALWRDQGFGAQVMVMNRASAVVIDGVEMRRMGQAGRLGRYPLHWHLLSYDSSGRELGDATGHVVRNSAIWNSRQRCIVIHGTNGVQVKNNVCHDIKGHAIFIEDGTERRNVIEDNLVTQVRSPVDALAVSQHEKRGHMCGSAAAYWLTNPDNTVRRNVAVDAQGNGFWLSYARQTVKEGRPVALRPNSLQHAPFAFNTARGNGNLGVMLECAMTDDAGNLELLYYEPTTSGAAFDWTNGVRFTLEGIATIKNRGGYLNRARFPDYLRWTAADNIGRAFTGAVAAGTLKQSLVVGRTLNNATPYPADADPQLAVASYHSTLDVAQNTFAHLVNRGYVLTQNGWDKSSGVFGTDDYYVRPAEKGFWRNPGNRLIDADPGYRALPPHLQANWTLGARNNWTLAGAIWDPQGYWSTANRWWVLDHPFLRDNTCTTLISRVPSGQANGLSCAGPYYGVVDFELDRGMPGATTRYLPMETLDVERRDGNDQFVARWRIEHGYDSNFLGHMRHFTALRGGTYVLRFPDFPHGSATKRAPRWVGFSVENVAAAGDQLLLGVHYDGGTAPSRVLAALWGDSPNFGVNARLLTAVGSKAEVVAGNGDRYWRDTANHLVWMKLTPLALNAWPGVVAGSDDDLYRGYQVRIEP